MTHDGLFNFCILTSHISPPMFLSHLTPPDPDSARPPGLPGPSLRTQGPPLGRLCRIVQIDQEKVLSKTQIVAIGFFEVLGLRNEQQWQWKIVIQKILQRILLNSTYFNLGPRDWKGDIIYLSTVIVSINWCSKLMFAIPDKNRNGLHPSDTVARKGAWQTTCLKMYIETSVTLHACF